MSSATATASASASATAPNALSASAATPSPTLASASPSSSAPVHTPPASVPNPASATSSASAIVHIPLDSVAIPTSSTSPSSAIVNIPLDSVATPTPSSTDSASVHTPPASATIPTSSSSTNSASVNIPTDSAPTPATLKRKLSTTSIAESSTDSSSSSSSSATPIPKRVCINVDAESQSQSQCSTKFMDPWDLLEGSEWDHLGGAHHVHQVKWKRAHNDVVQIFDQDMIKKINKKASGVKVELTNNNKVLKVQGPQQKVDRAWDFLQQLVVTETPVATTYVVIDVVGVDADAKLDSLSQAIGDAGKTIPAEKLHFSVCHSSPSFSASEAIALAEELDEKMKPTTLPRNLNSIFKCNKKVFFNVDGRHQVLGVVPEGTTSPPHQLIKFVQSTLSSSDLDMEATPHVTIINRRSPNAQNSRADQDRRLVAEINKYNCDHDWLGPLTIKGVKVSRQVLDLTTKQLDHFTLWEMVLQ